MDIQYLLNSPVTGSRHSRNAACSSSSLPAQQDLTSVIAPKRQKLAKDAPIFAEGTKIFGNVNYAPYEAGNDRNLQARHREFCVFPLGEISKKGVRHIPYASDKKDFLEKTGRDAFEVFQYTYRRPGEDKEYVVVWDYNIGLVRMTPFFKSCKYSKTVPAKALNQNPGMRDISYSITGGALVCQGYWVPWQAAREIAATFCWDIRWALTPVFGNDFPQICRSPKHCMFGKFFINPETVQFCTTETERFRNEGAAYQLLLPKAPPPIATSAIPIFTTPTWEKKVLAATPESGYGTDEEPYKISFASKASPRSQYGTRRSAPLNDAGSPSLSSTAPPSTLSSPVFKFAPTPMSVSTTVPDAPHPESVRPKRTHSDIMYDDDREVIKAETQPVVREDLENPTQDPHPLKAHSPHTIEVAEILLSMSVVVRNAAALPDPKRTRRGSRHQRISGPSG